jgi:uncharacterized membrane protein YbhN (UPF0104 family)
MLSASVYEVTGQLSTAGVIASYGILFYGSGPSALPPKGVYLLLLATPLVWAGVHRCARWLNRVEMDRPESTAVGLFFRTLWPVPVYYAVYFLIYGTVPWLVLLLRTGEVGLCPFGYVISVFAASWLVGFITPGAPGGIGVRETALILGLTPAAGEPLSVAVALLARIMSLIGDLLFFSLACVVRVNQLEHSGPMAHGTQGSRKSL